MAVYPGALWGGNVRGVFQDDPDLHEKWHDDIQNEVKAMQTEFGVNPSGAFATVVSRLNNEDTRYNAQANDIATLQAGTAKKGGTWRRVANQSIGAGALVAVSWDTEDEDTPGTMWNIGTPTVQTIPETATWAICYRALMGAVFAAGSYVRIAVGATDYNFPIVSGQLIGVAEVVRPITAATLITCSIFNAGGAANGSTSLVQIYKTAA
jgi:hypothetical protein